MVLERALKAEKLQAGRDGDGASALAQVTGQDLVADSVHSANSRGVSGLC